MADGAERPRGVKARALRWIYRHRGLMAAPPLIYALMSFRCETEQDWLVWPLGGLLVVAGVALRVWAQAHIRFRLRLRRHLATTGPYAIVRNPLYIANSAICVGCTIASELLWLVPVTSRTIAGTSSWRQHCPARP